MSTTLINLAIDNIIRIKFFSVGIANYTVSYRRIVVIIRIKSEENGMTVFQLIIKQKSQLIRLLFHEPIGPLGGNILIKSVNITFCDVGIIVYPIIENHRIGSVREKDIVYFRRTPFCARIKFLFFPDSEFTTQSPLILL